MYVSIDKQAQGCYTGKMIENDRILLSHGGGGNKMHRLIEDVFARSFSNPILNSFEDASIFSIESGELAFTTDSYTVRPLFFAGGDIGKLAVCGTVNDLAMRGAKPLHLSASFIIEEGLELPVLARIVDSMAETLNSAGVTIITGDTKVVEKGCADGLFINTTGVGVVQEGIRVSNRNARPGDRVIMSGPVGDHGVAVLLAREEFHLRAKTSSDCAPLNGLVELMLTYADGVHTLRDPTRGGVAAVLNEIAGFSEVGIILEESEIPIREEVRGVSEILGLDPLYIPNEGMLVCVCSEEVTTALLGLMKGHPHSRMAAAVGRVVAEPKGVWLSTAVGGTRALLMPEDEQLPRIC
jgi:hydrogenase expression/formation protein HypE